MDDLGSAIWRLSRRFIGGEQVAEKPPEEPETPAVKAPAE
jgi:hypothetical protein